MIRAGTREDLAQIVDLFARSNDAPSDLGAVAEEKCFGPGVSGDPEVRVYGDFAGVSVTCGKFLRIIAVDRAARRRGVGSALLREAQARGNARVVAAEAGNYLTPGIDVSDTATIAFFTKHGYREVARTQNLITTDLPHELPAGVFRVAPQQRDRVLAFIEAEFGRIWRFEAARAFANDPATLFFTESDDVITGFAAHDANNRGLGFFGPTGVGREYRGQGLGGTLLRASLADLRRLGHDSVVIPWTDAIGFYRKACGASVAERFVTLSL